MFRRVTSLKSWVIGSLESETGSEYLFGYDPSDGLVWLERSGIEYSPLDEVWSDAEGYIRTSMGSSHVVEEEERERPRTVTRSVASFDEDVLVDDDPRIVGDFGLTDDAMDVEDEDIAAQATAFLLTLEDE